MDEQRQEAAQELTGREPVVTEDPSAFDINLAHEVIRELTNRRASMRGRKKMSRIVNRDFGNGPRKQPRNARCACGSGLKAKRCCVYFEVAAQVQQQHKGDD